MTYNEFLSECSKRTIHESIALENDKVIEALQTRNDVLLLKLLDSEF